MRISALQPVLSMVAAVCQIGSHPLSQQLLPVPI
jgi:hypothetical protein